MKKLVITLATASVVFAGLGTNSVLAEKYEVQQQDSLWGIANEYDTSVQSLLDLNELDSTVIHPGQEIITEMEDKIELYEVDKGDTLSGIATDYDVTVKQLKDWNHLSTTMIHIGQELEIKGEVKEAEKVDGKVSAENTSEKKAETITVKATAYTAKCKGCTGITSTGIDLNANPNKKVIAVDPSVIPLGSEVHVEGYGNAIAGDIGGAIKGNRIDIHVPTTKEANSWGVRTVDVTILN